MDLPILHFDLKKYIYFTYVNYLYEKHNQITFYQNIQLWFDFLVPVCSMCNRV